MSPRYRSKYTAKVIEITHILKDKKYRCQVVDPGESRSRVGDCVVIKEDDLFNAWEILEAC